MLQRPIWMQALVALGLLASSGALASDQALVLTGNDFGLYTVDLSGGAVQHRETYTGFPGTGFTDGSIYVAVVSGEDRAYVYNAVTLDPVAVLDTGPGSNPYGAAIDAEGRIFITCLGSNQVVRFDLSGNETGRAAVGRSPQGIVVHQGAVYVANTGFRFSDYGYDPGTVMVLDPATLAVLDTVAVGTNPQTLAADAGGVHVLCTGNYVSAFGEVHILRGAAVDTVVLGGSPGGLALDGGSGFAVDYFGGIYRYDAATGTVLHGAASPLTLGGSGYTSCAGDGMGHLYVTLYDNDVVAKISESTETLVDTYPTGDGPQNVVLCAPAPTPVRPGPLPEPLVLQARRNPVHGAVALTARGITGPGRVELVDITGRLVASRKIVSDGVFSFSAPVAGHYFARVIQGNRTAATRVVVLP